MTSVFRKRHRWCWGGAGLLVAQPADSFITVPSTWSSGKYRIGRLSGSIRIQEVQQKCKSSVYMISFKSGLGRPFAIFGTTGTTVPSLSGEKTYPTSNFIPKSIFTKLQMRHISPSSAMASKHLGPHLSKDGGWHRTVRSAKGIGLFRRWQCKTGFFRFTLTLLGSILAYPTW